MICRCRETELWTFSGLVGAFLDLGITYFLLCASTLAYLVYKFLALFGKCLPCPCNGQFGDPYGNKCWQKTLVKCPSDKISSVQFSAMSSFPFDSVLKSNFSFGSNDGNEMEHDNEGVPLEAETSCSLSKERNTELGVGKTGGCARDLKDGRFDAKVDGVSSLEPRILRQRRRGGARNLRFSSVASQDHLQSYVQALSQTPTTASEMTNEISEGSSAPSGSTSDVLDLLDAGKAAMDVSFPSGVLCGSESTEPIDGNKSKNALPAGDLKREGEGEGVGELSFYGDEKDTIRVLQQELEEQHAASTALRIELEKERSASASAADEAMAMILRLQEEKASVEMEARQYQRMIEEKSAYDFEEMNILKEILVRREKEKHFLEKEVEAYREMIFGNEQLDSDVRDIGSNDNKRSSSLYSHENQALMLQKVSEYFNEVENGNTFAEAEAGPIESLNHSLAFGKALPIPDTDEVNSFKQDCFHRNPSIDEHRQYLSTGIEVTNKSGKKEMVPINQRSFAPAKDFELLGAQFQLSFSGEGCNSTAATGGVYQECDGISTSQVLASKTVETSDQAESIFPYNFGDSEKHEKDTFSVEFSASLSIHNVHVVDEKPSVCSEVIVVGSKKPSLDAALDIPTTFNSPTTRRLENKQDTRRSCSDMASWLPSTGCPRSKSLLSEFRRNSMSAVDYERFKIDSEVGWLREAKDHTRRKREAERLFGSQGEEKLSVASFGEYCEPASRHPAINRTRRRCLPGFVAAHILQGHVKEKMFAKCFLRDTQEQLSWLSFHGFVHGVEERGSQTKRVIIVLSLRGLHFQSKIILKILQLTIRQTEYVNLECWDYINHFVKGTRQEKKGPSINARSVGVSRQPRIDPITQL